MGEEVVEKKTSLMPLTTIISDMVETLNGINFETQDIVVIFTTRKVLRKISELDYSPLLDFGYIPQ